MKGHSPEHAGGPAFASGKEGTPWHVHPSANPSFHVSASTLWRPFVFEPPHAPNLVLIASSYHRRAVLATARPQRPPRHA
jgi:hypothetical protein